MGSWWGNWRNGYSTWWGYYIDLNIVVTWLFTYNSLCVQIDTTNKRFDGIDAFWRITENQGLESFEPLWGSVGRWWQDWSFVSFEQQSNYWREEELEFLDWIYSRTRYKQVFLDQQSFKLLQELWQLWSMLLKIQTKDQFILNRYQLIGLLKQLCHTSESLFLHQHHGALQAHNFWIMWFPSEKRIFYKIEIIYEKNMRI